ncbi:sarcosine oxidase subunit gamma family protein [Sulfitobacter sp. LCG007]
MVELDAVTPCWEALPLGIGEMMLREPGIGAITAVSPFRGKTAQLSKALKSAHGFPWPEPGTSSERSGRRVIWFGRETALLSGIEPDPKLARHAALVDQSDAWAAVELSGAGAEAVLARLVPLDLRIAQFGPGRTARSLVGHMNASITRTAENAFLIIVFRSMAATLIHELSEAMARVHARHG